MLKSLLFVLFCAWALPVIADEHLCAGVGSGLAYRPVELNGVVACFVYVEMPREKQGQLSRDPDGIAIYSVSKSEGRMLVYDLPYAETKGVISDVFAFSVTDAIEKVLFVVHSVEAPMSWDAVSDIYDVAVIRAQTGRLVKDEKLSRFFGLGGDLLDMHVKGGYVYPYKERRAVVGAVRSLLFDFICASVSVSGVVQEKAFLYGGDVEPSVQDPKGMYLIKGDKVMLEDSTAGWCKVSYLGGGKEIKRWMQCKSLIFGKN